jgi:hypothetical protein
MRHAATAGEMKRRHTARRMPRAARPNAVYRPVLVFVTVLVDGIVMKHKI